jgi:hypothetical protein
MPRLVQKPLAMVSIDYPPGFTEVTFPVVKALIDDARADYFEYLPPCGWIVCYKPSAAARAQALVARVHALRESDARFKGIGAATRTGCVVYERSFWGRVRSLPLGDWVNAVMRDAAADARDE